MAYKKKLKLERVIQPQDHHYDSNPNQNEKSEQSFLKGMMKSGSQFNVISGFATLFLVGAVIGLVIYDSKFNRSNTAPE